jgi:hypothetical protein
MLTKTPRRRGLPVSSPNQRSTRLSQLELVGMKWATERGRKKPDRKGKRRGEHRGIQQSAARRINTESDEHAGLVVETTCDHRTRQGHTEIAAVKDHLNERGLEGRYPEDLFEDLDQGVGDVVGHTPPEGTAGDQGKRPKCTARDNGAGAATGLVWVMWGEKKVPALTARRRKHRGFARCPPRASLRRWDRAGRTSRRNAR